MTALLKVTRVDMSRLLNLTTLSCAPPTAAPPDRLNERQCSLSGGHADLHGRRAALSVLPKDTPIYAIINRFTAGGLFTLGVAYLCIKKAKDGKPPMDFKQVMSAGTVWGPLLLIAADPHRQRPLL